MKHLYSLIASILMPLGVMAQGWPANYGGVMLQAFSWDSFEDTNWAVLEQQADELTSTFDLVWIPQSGNCGGTSMGYDDLYWFNNYNSSFGTEAQLRSLINTLKAKNTKTIADVVINHRRNLSSWFDFPKETYQGQTYEMLSTDICADDDGGATKKEADKQGVSLSQNKDTGEGWGGMRDLDHKSENVQRIVKAYLQFLRQDLGYAGFRYDMVKGYSPAYTGMYNTTSQPEFSVGECWDGTNTIKNWIDGTKVDGKIQSAAFDFQFKYVVRNATDNNDWRMLKQQNDGNWPLVSSNAYDGTYRRYAVTFVENHDTQVRPDGTSNGPLKRDTLAANAYLLAMPGTPCIFQPHWIKYSTEIKAMVAARKAVGIASESAYEDYLSSNKYFGVYSKVNGQNAMLTMLGDFASIEKLFTSKGWVKVVSGYHYAYYFPNTMETAYIDLATSTYTGVQKATLTAVSAATDALLVYTTDGSDPTASSNKAASGTVIDIPVGTTVLKVALLKGGQVSGTITRTYVVKQQVSDDDSQVPSFCRINDGEVCAFFVAPLAWTDIWCWAWTDSPSDNFTYANKRWPGVQCQMLGLNNNGKQVWKWTWDGTKQNNSAATQPAKIIFNDNGRSQTADMPFENGGYYGRDGLITNVTAGIDDITDNASVRRYSSAIYTTDGRRVSSTSRPGVYIRNGKKFVVK